MDGMKRGVLFTSLHDLFKKPESRCSSRLINWWLISSANMSLSHEKAPVPLRVAVRQWTSCILPGLLFHMCVGQFKRLRRGLMKLCGSICPPNVMPQTGRNDEDWLYILTAGWTAMPYCRNCNMTESTKHQLGLQILQTPIWTSVCWTFWNKSDSRRLHCGSDLALTHQGMDKKPSGIVLRVNGLIAQWLP